MFEDKTYDSLLQAKLAMVDDNYDKREGSVIYDAIAPNSAEQAQAYIYMDYILEQMFGTTADREHLILIADGTRGMAPYAATYAILKAATDVAVPVGTRFNLDDLNYVVKEAISEPNASTGMYEYKVQCESLGAEGNRHLGAMTPIEYVANLTTAEIVSVLIPGEDEEATEDFRKRWKEAFNYVAYGGNKADYRQKIKSIDGVGGVKVYRATTATGEEAGIHVKCVIINSMYEVPSSSLVASVQQTIDPTQDQEGLGLAPIGHIVHIAGVAGTTINIASTITYDSGYTFNDVKSYIEAAVDGYFKTIAQSWESSGDSGQIVRISQIESAILDVQGVLDITGTTLNGTSSNITLGKDAIPVRGTING